MNGITFLLFFGIMTFSLNVNAQSLVDIEIDSIHCQDGKCYFLNFTDEDIYNCYFYALQQSEFRYKQAIECDLDEKLNKLPKKENTLKLKKIQNLDELKEWIAKTNFSHTFTGSDMKMSSHFQSINQNFGVTTYQKLDTTTNEWTKNRTQLYQIIPIKVNDEYYIAGLLNLEYIELEHFLVPTINDNGILFNNKTIYYSTQKKESLKPVIYWEIFDKIKVRELNGTYILTNMYSKANLLDKEFDKITIEYPYVIGEINDQKFIYDKDLKNVLVDKLSHVYPHFKSVQLITNNKVKWLDQNGTITDTMPIIRQSICVVGIPCYETYIQKVDDNFYEVIWDCNSFLDEEKKDTVKFDFDRSVAEITYIDIKRSPYLYFSENNAFNIEPNLYYFKTTSGEEGIFRHINEKAEKINEVQNNTNLKYDEKRNKIKVLEDSLETTYKDQVIFEGKFEAFILDSYNQPIKFKKNGLFGVYPQMTEAKYKSIGRFNGYLAEVIFKNGDKGWIDLEGDEIRGRIE